MRIAERRVPVGVIGANYEARANVTVDVASQLVKSRNAGVLRTGGAALETAAAVVDRAIAPALAAAGLPAEAVGLVRTPDREAARALCSLPALVPLVILRGSGPTTRDLAGVAAAHGVRTLAHAEGGGVLYVHPSADRAAALGLVESSLDRLGVCNRLNLLLLAPEVWDDSLPAVEALLERLGVAPLAAAARPPPGPRVGHRRRARGHGDRRPRRLARGGGARSPTARRPAWPRASRPATRRRPSASWPPTGAPAPSGT